jgi:hypothetical protein
LSFNFPRFPVNRRCSSASYYFFVPETEFRDMQPSLGN